MEGQTTIDMDPKSASRDLSYYEPLYQAAVKGNWDAARGFIERDRNASTAIITDSRRTLLHVAAAAGRSEFIEKLLEILPAESLDARDDCWDNALHYVARSGTLQCARRMVDKNPNLLQSNNSEQKTPLHAAVVQGRQPSKASKEMVRFLAEVTKDAFTGDSAGYLIVEITSSGFYDTTLFLLERYPQLAVATYQGKTILHSLATDPLSFREGSKLATCTQLIHPRTKIINGQKLPIEITKLICASARSMKLFESVPSNPLSERDDKYWLADALHVAIMNGVIEMVRVYLKYLPNVLWVYLNERTLLHVAIEYRQWKIFKYLIELAGEKKHQFFDFKDKRGGNILHLAARMPFSQLDSASALQMQQELQWFKAVEKLVDTRLKFERDEDGRTPQEIFKKEHKLLLQSGEGWMKSTSNAGMVVATLAATIVFAAIISVPGGHDDKTGFPIFLEKGEYRESFMVYAVSVAVALFSSMTSLLTFLLIHTSRFGEEDFLERLPRELMVSLAFLLFAIIAMTVAFVAALQLALDPPETGWIYMLCLPIVVSTMRLYRLFFRIFKSTYSPMISS